MITIRPVSDLRNKFTEIEDCVKSGKPVYLTKNGYGSMVVLSLEQYADLQQALQIIGAKYKPDQMETFGNTNKTGNRIYMVVKEWAEQKKSRSG